MAGAGTGKHLESDNLPGAGVNRFVDARAGALADAVEDDVAADEGALGVDALEEGGLVCGEVATGDEECAEAVDVAVVARRSGAPGVVEERDALAEQEPAAGQAAAVVGHGRNRSAPRSIYTRRVIC